ncbi:MAG: FAD-dependent oxidoreductase [Anaerolineales bacterium]
MNPETFHTIVIGAGSGGMTVAVGMANLGHPVALVEGAHVGGDCTNVGCVPSKTLIHLAREFRPGDDPDEVLRTVIRKRDALRDKETEEARGMENVTFIQGWAAFRDAHTLEVSQLDGSTRTLRGKNIVIASGARPRPLEIPGLPEERTLTNESLFDLTDAPKHLAIVGAGIIALEMAFAFQKLGVQVTVFALDERPIPRAIPEASQAIQAELERRGITTLYGATAKSYDESTRTLLIQQGERKIPLPDVDKVLIAIGRLRNIERLSLEAAGVRYDRNGIAVNHYGKTSAPGVYAIGDVTPTSAFTHSANAQGRRVVQHIAFPWMPVSRREPLYPSATFSDPEVATVGTPPDGRCHPQAVRRIRVDFKTHTDRGYTDEIENGFIIVDAVRLTGRILHATIVGPHASEMISFFTLAMTQGISLYKIYRLVYPYPTFSSGILKVTDFFLQETLTNLPREIGAYLRYRFARP